MSNPNRDRVARRITYDMAIYRQLIASAVVRSKQVRAIDHPPTGDQS